MNYTTACWNDLKSSVLCEKLYGGRNKLYPKKPGVHIAAAAWMTPSGDIYTGQDHTAAANRAARLGNKDAKKVVDSGLGVHIPLRDIGWRDGFLASNRQWVNREEAMNIAKKSKQVKAAEVPFSKLDSYDVATI